MHEVSLAEDIVAIVDEHARRAGAKRVLRVNLRVGEFSGVVPEALEFAFAAVRAGSLADRAELHVELVPVVARCHACGTRFAATGAYGVFLCPACGEPAAAVERGAELEVASVEVE